MESKAKLRPDSKLRPMDQVKQVLRYHHYAYRTEQTYCDWILRCVKFHGSKTHPKDMGKTHVEAFLIHLVTQGRVSASTQKQALNAGPLSLPARAGPTQLRERSLLSGQNGIPRCRW